MHLERQPSSPTPRSASSRSSAAPGDFSGYVARNAPPAYRLAAIILDDPVAAQDLVHDALMGAWQIGSAWPARSLDSAFGRRMIGQLRGSPRDESTALLHGLAMDDLVILIEHLVLAGEIGPVIEAVGGRRKADRKAEQLLGAADVRGDGRSRTDALVEVFAARDPGEEPSQLRWRLQRSLTEAEQALAEQAEIAADSGWGFAIKFFGLLVIGILVVSAMSVAALRSQTQGSPDSAGAAAGLLPARVVVVSPPGETQTIHVAATRDTLFAMVEATWQRDRFARGCQPDTVGLVDSTGTAQWLGDVGLHVDLVAGDVSSGKAHLIGRDALCARVDSASTDGGRTWGAARADTSLPESASLLGMDPAHGRLVAAAAGHAWVSADGVTWSESARPIRPIGFDTTGRLVGWSNGRIVDSYDGGATWLDVEEAPRTPPVAAAAVADGVLLGGSNGLWWQPYGGDRRLVQPGRVLAVQAIADGALAVGLDEQGRVWISTIFEGLAYPAAVPDGVASLYPTGAEIAGNQGGALVAFAGAQSSIVFVGFEQPPASAS